MRTVEGSVVLADAAQDVGGKVQLTQAKPARVSFHPRDAFLVVPALLTLGLGLLYGAGALIKSGQLRAAGLSVQDTLPLVPLEQILALGIGTLVTSLIWVVILACWLWTYVYWNPEPITLSLGGRKRLAAYRIAVWGLILFVIGVWFYNEPFATAINSTVIVFLGPTVVRIRHRGRVFVLCVVLGFFLFVMAVKTASAYLSPAPLPHASLQLEGDPGLMQGTLIVSTGEAWYLTNRSKTYRAVPRSTVRSAVIRSKERREPRPVLKVVWQWLIDR